MTTGAEGQDGVAAGTDYDLLPYLAMPISYTEPSRLAAVGRLLGVACPDVGTARVVEFGCATGGNLIPMAARHPGARFLGIDLSARQIADGQARIAALGLTNIELRQGDLATLDLPADSADYIICHGVFSWVPAFVQERILKTAHWSLTRFGILAVSYNALPGWHLRSPVRDILLAAAGPDGPPRERVARAREALDRLARDTSPHHGYGAVLRAEAVRMARMPSSYLMGEFLAEENNPVSFADFLEMARNSGLEYLAEADFSAAAADLVAQQARPTLADLTGPVRDVAEIRLDEASGRPFRRTLLVRTAGSGDIGPPGLAQLGRLHVSCQLEPDAAQPGSFKDGAGKTVSARTQPLAQALLSLAQAWPGTVPAGVLIGDGPDAKRVARLVLDLLATGRATLHAEPVSIGRAADMAPRAWPLARSEAATGQPWVTGLAHFAVMLDPMARALVGRLDGATSHADLAAWLAAEWAAGRLRPSGPAASGATPASAVAAALQLLERGAVLAQD